MRLLGVQVGPVAALAAGEREVMSGIHKRSVTGPVAVSALGLADDLPYGSLGENLTVQTGYCGFHFAVDRPGHIEAGQEFELVAGPRTTPLMALFPRPDRRSLVG